MVILTVFILTTSLYILLFKKTYENVYLFAQKLFSNYCVLCITLGLDDKNSLWPKVAHIVMIKGNNSKQALPTYPSIHLFNLSFIYPITW